MLLLTEDAVLECIHQGTVRLDPIQDWVRINGRVVLVEGDPFGRPIIACRNATPVTPPCLTTISVDKGASYSQFVRVDGLLVCMDTATGTTDWSLQGTTPYNVRSAGQELVRIGG